MLRGRYSLLMASFSSLVIKIIYILLFKIFEKQNTYTSLHYKHRIKQYDLATLGWQNVQSKCPTFYEDLIRHLITDSIFCFILIIEAHSWQYF